MKPLREHFEIETDAGTTLRTFDYIDALERHIDGATREYNLMGEQLKQERNKTINEIKKHVGWDSFDADGLPVTIEVQKLQQYLTSLLAVKVETK